MPAMAGTADHRRRPLGASGTSRTASQASTVSATTTAEATRFEYSIQAWPDIGGTTSPWHPGQSGQPSPESVSRTSAPLGMMNSRPASETAASRSAFLGETVQRPRNRDPHAIGGS